MIWNTTAKFHQKYNVKTAKETEMPLGNATALTVRPTSQNQRLKQLKNWHKSCDESEQKILNPSHNKAIGEIREQYAVEGTMSDKVDSTLKMRIN